MKKPLLSLTNEDLAVHPIWLYEGESDVLASVSPSDSFAQPDQRAYIARTRFTLRNATVMFGYCSPTEDSGLDYIQPVVIGPSGHIPFWRDPPETPLSDAEIAAQLGKLPEDVFPCTFESLVPFEGVHLVRAIFRSDAKGLTMRWS